MIHFFGQDNQKLVLKTVIYFQKIENLKFHNIYNLDLLQINLGKCQFRHLVKWTRMSVCKWPFRLL